MLAQVLAALLPLAATTLGNNADVVGAWTEAAVDEALVARVHTLAQADVAQAYAIKDKQTQSCSLN